jgi:hypothetical integral membrane protein (TIGR02206 family)
MEAFRAYSAWHYAMLLAIGLALAIAIGLRRRRAVDAWATGPMERAVALGYLAVWIGSFVWLRFSRYYDPLTTYPLQMCHWCAVIAAVSLIRPYRALRAIAYFCGLALCTQAIITPGLTEGPALYRFWFFWVSHGIVLGVPLYDVAARGYRPHWRDYAIGCVAALAYVAIVLPIDLATGWNYGFVGPGKPETPSIVDFLGPWPLRLVWIVLLAAAAMFVLLVPWMVSLGRNTRALASHRMREE